MEEVDVDEEKGSVWNEINSIIQRAEKLYATIAQNPASERLKTSLEQQVASCIEMQQDVAKDSGGHFE